MIVVNENRMIFPFLSKNVDIDYLGKIVRKNKKEKDVYPWGVYQIKPHEIRKELRELNCLGNNSKIFSSFRLDRNCYGLYSIDFSKLFIIPQNKLEEIPFSIVDVCVHSFASGISFLEIKYEVDSTNEQDVLNMNYYLSELKSDIELRFVRSCWNAADNRKEDRCDILTVPNLLKRILSDFDDITDIDSDSSMKSYSSKPILFSYFLLDNPEDEIVKHLGLNMKASYKINEDVLIQTKCFDNSVWLYSLNSTVNVSFLSQDEITNNFFKTTFIDKINNLYFFLFLQSLHQRFFLQLCHCKIKSYNFELMSLDENKKLIDELSGYSANFNKAWLKYFFDKPSSIDHVNVFYSTVRSSFGIQEHADLIVSDLNMMMEYVDKKYRLFDEHNKLVSNMKKSKVDLVTFLVASIISFVSIYDTFIKMLKNFGIELAVVTHIVWAIIFMIICFIVPTTINFYYSFKKIIKISKEIHRVEELICSNQTIGLF